jgi:hypothetical protein
VTGSPSRNVTFTFNASTQSLLEGQTLGIEEVTWHAPLTPDRKVTSSEPEIVVTRGGEAQEPTT